MDRVKRCKREGAVSGHKYKIGQLVNYSAATLLRAFIRSPSYCRQKALYSSIASRTSTNLTNV
jgi:hypothetical protein